MASLEGRLPGFVPEFCNIDEKELISYPIQYIGFSFDGAIEVEENIKAIIYSDGKPVEAGCWSVRILSDPKGRRVERI